MRRGVGRATGPIRSAAGVGGGATSKRAVTNGRCRVAARTSRDPADLAAAGTPPAGGAEAVAVAVDRVDVLRAAAGRLGAAVRVPAPREVERPVAGRVVAREVPVEEADLDAAPGRPAADRDAVDLAVVDLAVVDLAVVDRPVVDRAVVDLVAVGPDGEDPPEAVRELSAPAVEAREVEAPAVEAREVAGCFAPAPEGVAEPGARSGVAVEALRAAVVERVPVDVVAALDEPDRAVLVPVPAAAARGARDVPFAAEAALVVGTSFVAALCPTAPSSAGAVGPAEAAAVPFTAVPVPSAASGARPPSSAARARGGCPGEAPAGGDGGAGDTKVGLPGEPLTVPCRPIPFGPAPFLELVLAMELFLPPASR